MIYGSRFAGLILSIWINLAAIGQSMNYTVANAHSHNDYENPIPFYTAYEAGFGSIEADIFLEQGRLYVAHDTIELKRHRTLEQYYLNPLRDGVDHHNGHPYLNSSAVLQMLIDIKTDSIQTLDTLIKVLAHFPSLINNASIRWVITGNRPTPTLFVHYPAYIFFDGELGKIYRPEELLKVALFSGDFTQYCSTNRYGAISDSCVSVLFNAVGTCRRLGKPVRFWHAPDNVHAWRQLEDLGVGYINTDHIHELAAFLKQQ